MEVGKYYFNDMWKYGVYVKSSVKVGDLTVISGVSISDEGLKEFSRTNPNILHFREMEEDDFLLYMDDKIVEIMNR